MFCSRSLRFSPDLTQQSGEVETEQFPDFGVQFRQHKTLANVRQLIDHTVGKLRKLRMFAGPGDFVRVADRVTQSESRLQQPTY